MDQNERLTQALVEFYERFSSWEHAVVKDSGITLPQMHTLEVLGSCGPLRMKELAGKMGVTMGALTVLADRLVRAGLVAREPNEHDRRSILVRLTPEGEQHFREHHRLHLELSRELTSELSSEEAAVFLDLLGRVGSRF